MLLYNSFDKTLNRTHKQHHGVARQGADNNIDQVNKEA